MKTNPKMVFLNHYKIVESSVQSVKKVRKERKLSKEEDRLAECRQELQAVADAESKVMKNKVMNGIGIIGKDEPFENTENTEHNESKTESMDSGSTASEGKSVESISDSVENMLETGEKTRYDTKKKIEYIERKLNHIIERMDKKENEEKNLQNKAGYHGLLARIKILENEKRDLSLENAALKKELSDFKTLSDKWNIPKKVKLLLLLLLESQDMLGPMQ